MWLSINKNYYFKNFKGLSMPVYIGIDFNVLVLVNISTDTFGYRSYKLRVLTFHLPLVNRVVMMS